MIADTCSFVSFRKFLGACLILILVFLPTTGLALDEHAGAEYNKSVQFANALSSAFEDVARIITPSLVFISSVKKPDKTTNPFEGKQGEQLREYFGDEFLKRYFGDQGGAPHQQQGLGSGFILDDKGHILTNNHVITDADEIKVRLADRRSVTATVVGTDPRTDLAVLKIDEKNLVPVTLGDSSKLKIGEWVVAAGNPFGFDNSITAGIVSAKSRSISRGVQYEDFIQTDAAINPGNSGGPLVNLKGEVVGINSAIFTRSGGYMGIGFAIPVNMAKRVVTSLIENGKVVRGWLGVAIQDVTEDLAASFQYSGQAGALVGDVTGGSPAEAAGIQQGDIVTSFNGKEVRDVNDLRNRVAAIAPNENIKLKVYRDGKIKNLTVKIGELKVTEEISEVESESMSQEMGLSVETLTPELKRRVRSQSNAGVVVSRVDPYSMAARVGIRAGDVIVKVGKKAVTSASDFFEAVEKADLDRGVRLIVETQGMKRFVVLRDES